jgi:hypothetical protein
MNDIQALVVKNELNLPQERINSLVNSLRQRSISFLSPEKEGGPFLLYCCGDDLEKVALKTNYPVEVILLTAIQYRWNSKAGLLQKTLGDANLLDIQKDMAKMLLIATHTSIQKELGDVIAGRLDPDKSSLIPKTIKGLNELMTMVNGITDKINDLNNPQQPQAAITVQATNVQINQGSPEPKKSKLDRLKELEGGE